MLPNLQLNKLLYVFHESDFEKESEIALSAEKLSEKRTKIKI